MYNPYDENNMVLEQHRRPVEQDTEKKENESAESAAQERLPPSLSGVPLHAAAR